MTTLRGTVTGCRTSYHDREKLVGSLFFFLGMEYPAELQHLGSMSAERHVNPDQYCVDIPCICTDLPLVRWIERVAEERLRLFEVYGHFYTTFEGQLAFFVISAAKIDAESGARVI